MGTQQKTWPERRTDQELPLARSTYYNYYLTGLGHRLIEFRAEPQLRSSWSTSDTDTPPGRRANDYSYAKFYLRVTSTFPNMSRVEADLCLNTCGEIIKLNTNYTRRTVFNIQARCSPWMNIRQSSSKPRKGVCSMPTSYLTKLNDAHA